MSKRHVIFTLSGVTGSPFIRALHCPLSLWISGLTLVKEASTSSLQDSHPSPHQFDMRLCRALARLHAFLLPFLVNAYTCSFRDCVHLRIGRRYQTHQHPKPFQTTRPHAPIDNASSLSKPICSATTQLQAIMTGARLITTARVFSCSSFRTS